MLLYFCLSISCKFLFWPTGIRGPAGELQFRFIQIDSVLEPPGCAYHPPCGIGQDVDSDSVALGGAWDSAFLTDSA